MSCGIHLFAEKRVDGVWVHAQEDDVVTEKTGCGEYRSIPHEKDLCDIQNYELFAMLAGVRNYYQIKPIAEPRGLPTDLSSFVAERAEAWYGDAHNYSWLTLQELKGFDWTGHNFTRRAFVTTEDAERYRAIGVQPSCIIRCGDNPGPPPPRHEYFEWMVTYAEEAKDFLERTVPKLEKFGEPGDVRIVFWFDN